MAGSVFSSLSEKTSPDKFGNFKKLVSFKTAYSSTYVTKWISERTGLQVVLLKKESPVVEGYFTVASEVNNDSGTPHTLEHLVFMGSNKYPYKGLLDILGNRLFSSTNAWTGVDQTVYTLETAGWEGFDSLLPIYLDHILHPTLTDSACLTEVYHVDGQCKEKGVVFSEMQGVENTSYSLMGLECQRLLYGKDSPFSSETGGLMENLRVLDNETIKEFHKLRYRPDNLCVIVTGMVEENELMDTMLKIDNEILPLPSTPHGREFVDTPTRYKLSESVVKRVAFPEKDTSFGEILMSWVGPHNSDIISNVAIDILGGYLSEGGASVLQKELVEIEDPLATDISYYTDDYIRTGVNFMFNSVPTDKLEECEQKAFKLLKSHCSSSKFDLSKIRECVEREKSQAMLSCENSAETLALVAVSDFLYGKRDGSDLRANAKDLSEYDELANWTAEQWSSLLKTYLIENKRVSILGVPSPELYASIKKENKERDQNTKLKLGEKGLAKLNQKLNDAQAINDAKIPDDIIFSVKSPNPANIRFITTSTARAGSAVKETGGKSKNELQQLIDNDLPSHEELPISIHFNDFESKFIKIDIFMSSFTVPKELLAYTEGILTELFTLPMKLDDGTELSSEEVINSINRDTVYHSIHPSINGQFEEMISVKFQVKNENYEKAIEWIQRGFWNTVFDEKKLQVLAEKHVNSIPERKREGENIMSSTINRVLLNDRSLCKAKDFLECESFYKELSTNLSNKNKFIEILNDLERLRDNLFTSNNFRIVVSGDIKSLKSAVQPWVGFTKKSFAIKFEPIVEVPRTIKVRSEDGIALANKAYISPVPATESTFLSLVTVGPSEYLDKDIPALAVACEYMQCVEGPFWRGIRGTGLAYGANLHRDVETGRIVFSIYRGSDAGKAVTVARDQVLGFADGTTELEDALMEGAVSSIVNSIAKSERNSFDASLGLYVDDILKGRGTNYNRQFMAALNAVTKDDVRYAMNKYLVGLYSPESSMAFVACNPSKSDDIKTLLESMNYEVTMMETIGGDDSEDESGSDMSEDESSSSGDSDGEDDDMSEAGSNGDEDTMSEDEP
ncbi:hypothetical protein NADFUDRAFT_81826 [Nadsonia fulvescens var. elongata DSM 6958]|uniref:Zinc metalloprotease n=1 Tax=Nadsonia fulvescens var. elongata DSM 6958 TaxID=857566 RepID=A0A1E3PPF0_9ASCO|nr:hypothetical protein NADFUDRAFT_81826 [Nadsonia fulvescens var. elongata DSM 6958]